jgi:hypothetical protein
MINRVFARQAASATGKSLSTELNVADDLLL